MPEIDPAGSRRPTATTDLEIPLPHLTLSATHARETGRAELEAFVHQAFAQSHEADVTCYMPTLLGFRDRQARLRGVLGLRNAGEERLYLEHYLEDPVESALHRLTGQATGRHEIVEVGNLAGANCRMAARMIAQLPQYLLSQRFNWIVFTATDTLRRILDHLGAPVMELGVARANRVANLPDHWGSYYERDPRVMAGFLPNGLGMGRL